MMLKLWLCYALLCSFMVVTFTSETRPPGRSPTKVYQINLDLPPRERWKTVAHDYAFLIPKMMNMIALVMPKSVLHLVEKIGSNLTYYISEPYDEEIIGCAKEMNISAVDLLLLNIYYELTAHCTSIIAEDSNHNIIHGRNLDYGFIDFLYESVIDVHFMKSNMTVYRGTTFAGFVGLITGQKDNRFSVSINQRDPSLPIWLNALTAIIEGDGSVVGFLLRNTLQEAVSFSDAAVRLATTVVIAPVYIILGGTRSGEGVVITRDRWKTVDAWFLEPRINRWYVLETNYDRWLPPPKWDDRRDAAMKLLNEIGSSGINRKNLFNVVTHKGVFTNHTIYTVIMGASQPDLYESWVWTY